MLAILAAVMLAAAPPHDTVYTADGGRIVGTVVEESPQSVSVQLADGTFRRLPRRDVVRIQYADGSVSQAPAPPPAYPPPAYAPPPAYPPPPPYTPPPPPTYVAPPRPRDTGPASPLWLSFGIGGMFFSGDVEQGVSASRIFEPEVEFLLEAGLRFNPHFGLGLYLDMGLGGPGSEVSSYCNTYMMDCTATNVRTGILLRHTFDPSAHVTPWFALGTGYAWGNVEAMADQYGPRQDILTYSGWEMARLMGGVDIRSSRTFGVGFYGGVAFTRFTEFENTDGRITLPDPTVHTMFEAGIRLTLFP